MKKQETLTCIDYTYDGLGVCKLESGIPVFVKGMIKGEVGKVEYLETKKSFYNGNLLSLDNTAPLRTKPLCPLFGYCGGCQLLHMDYQEQLNFKTKHVEDVINRLAKLNIKANPILENPHPTNYRNKIQVSFSHNYKDQVIGGFYQEGTHQIIDLKECYLGDKTSNQIISYFKYLIAKYKIEPYDRSSPYGSIRHLLVRSSSLNEYMVVIVTFSRNLPRQRELVNELTRKFPCIKSIVHNINSTRGVNILGREERVIYGKNYINDVLCNLKFKISPKSFYQVNHDQTERLYNYAIDRAELTGKELVLDAYSGIGTIGLIASKKAKKVVGVEIIEDAIRNATENMVNNEVKNASYFVGDASKFMYEQEQKGVHFDVVFVDPPRGGCDSYFLNSLIKVRPERIIYISCNPSTLARDLGILKESYEVKDVQPVDMFSNTYHVETICTLIKKA